MAYYSRTKTETLELIKANLSKPREFNGISPGDWEAYLGRNADDYRHLKMVEDELNRRAANPGIYEREMAALERSKALYGW